MTRSRLAGGCAAGTVLLALAAPASAQVECSVLSQAQLLTSFKDTSKPAAIGPRQLRDFVCSTPSLVAASNMITLSGAVVGTGTLVIPTTFGAIGAGHLVANATTASAPAADTALSPLLDIALGATRGSLIERGASGWAQFAPGTSGYVLVTQSTTNDAAWSSISSVLDGLGSLQGEILVRGAGAWSVLTVGGAGTQLTSNGTTASWATLERTWTLSWGSPLIVAAGTYPIAVKSQPTSLVIDSVSSITGGTGTPSFTFQLVANSTTLTCGGGTTITVGTAELDSTCTVGNTLAAGTALSGVVVAISGTPDQAGVQVNWHVVTP